MRPLEAAPDSVAKKKRSLRGLSAGSWVLDRPAPHENFAQMSGAELRDAPEFTQPTNLVTKALPGTVA